MVKLMAKKSKALPAHSLEEWQAQALQRYGSSSAAQSLLVTPHNAALRIQLRYRVYKEKVRALIKKSSVKDEGSGSSTDADTAAVVGSVKAAVRERGVKGSSVALAVAYTARKDLHGEVEPTQPLMLKTTGNKSYAPPAETLRSSIQEAATPSSWAGSHDWSMPSKEFVALSTDDGDNTRNGALVETKEENVVTKTKEMEKEDARVVVLMEDSQESIRNDKFVNIMHPSWLLSTIEERCGEAAASLGARGQHGSHKQLTMLDIRHTVLDLLFIARSGSSENFHGRAPSTISKHHDNLVQRLAAEKNELDDETRRRVRRIFESLQSDMFMPAVRCLGWMLTKTWRKLFSGLHVDVESLHRVRQVLEASGNVSVVFTPTHETHLDYLIISYLCFAYGIPLPRIAAGNNLDLPVIGSFLRANGSFFIRRSFKNDQLYKDVLQNYVHELLHDGNPIEVFIEGGRSRHGRVCKPKMGFLSMFRDYMNGVKNDELKHTENGQEPHKDLLLVPISLDYDRVFEVEEYANQLLGKPKEKESLKVFFQSLWDLMFLRCGHSYVRFGTPVSINAHESLKETAHDLAVQMQSCGTITSTAVVSALLMWKREYATRNMLMARAEWLVSELEVRGATVAHLQSVSELVDNALSVLDVEVTSSGVIHSKVAFPTRALELGFYRNHLLHVFLPDMALLGAIDALRLQSTPASNIVVLEKIEVLASASFVWKFLNHICRHERVDLAQHLETLELRVPELSLSADHVQLDLRKWRVSRVAGFALSLHWSFVDSLFLATLATWSLMEGGESQSSPVHLERDMLRLAQLLARELFVDRSISHAEAFCSESIKQAFEFLHEIGVVGFESCESTGARQYKLAASVDRQELLKLQDRVNALRKPRSFLYREDQPAAPLTEGETMTLVDRAVDESQQLAQRGRARGGVYATWMSH